MQSNVTHVEENFPLRTGASVTFHLLTWGRTPDTFSLRAGGNINYHSLRGTTELHSHEFPEIFLILSGRIRHFVNGEMQELTMGSLVFIRPSDRHRFEPLEEESCELVNFSFSLEAMRDLSEYLGNDFFLWRFTETAVPPLFHLLPLDTEHLALELLKVNTLQMHSVEMARIKVKSVLAELFIRYFLEEKNGLRGKAIPTWLEDLIVAMRQPKNFVRGLGRMQELACCTPEHLCKCFRKYLNRTPTDFVNELRISHAARQLVESNEEIYAIASDLNFRSISRFYHLFHKFYGVSPARYRALAKYNDIPI
jgi:AraC family cel operon transcriptional repressor